MSRSTGVALVLWATVAIAEPGAPGAGGGRDGRVVRVERSGLGRVPPRVCEIHGEGGTCVGEEPRSGQAVAVLDEHRVVAEVQIVEANSFSPTCPALWTVKTRPLRGAVSDGDGMGVIDPSLDTSRARLLSRAHVPPSPSGSADDEVWRAVDRDGDGAADILLTRYSCDAAGRPSTGGTYCIDVWARTGARMMRTAQINFALCNR